MPGLAAQASTGTLRRHVPMRFRLVLDAGDGGDEQKASLADGHRPVGIGEEVGESGGVEQVEECSLVLGVGDVGRDREVALALLRIDVEVAGGTVLRGARRRIVAKQRLGQGGLSRTIVCDDCDIADRFRIEHALVSPDAALKRERLDQPAALVEEERMRVLALCSIAVSLTALPAVAQLTQGAVAPSESFSLQDDGTSLGSNPAGLGFVSALEADFLHNGYYSRSRDDQTNALYLTGGTGGLALGLGFDWIRRRPCGEFLCPPGVDA